MSYTVRKLSKLSGVSIRTLHWYDEVGLLKPAYYGENGYRYYDEEQLLILQQILFFRELGFSLKDIQKILVSDDFDKIRALHAHKKTLEKDLGRIKNLVQTIDKTINHVRGEQKMKDKEFYKGFDASKNKGHEIFLASYQGTLAEELVLESKQKVENKNEAELQRIEKKGHEIYKALSKCMDKKLTPKSGEVQKIIQQHYEMTGSVHEVNKDVYLSLAQMYCEHPDFIKWFAEHYPDLPPFIAEAMRVYSYDKLS